MWYGASDMLKNLYLEQIEKIYDLDDNNVTTRKMTNIYSLLFNLHDIQQESCFATINEALQFIDVDRLSLSACLAILRSLWQMNEVIPYYGTFMRFVQQKIEHAGLNDKKLLMGIEKFMVEDTIKQLYEDVLPVIDSISSGPRNRGLNRKCMYLLMQMDIHYLRKVYRYIIANKSFNNEIGWRQAEVVLRTTYNLKRMGVPEWDIFKDQVSQYVLSINENPNVMFTGMAGE